VESVPNFQGIPALSLRQARLYCPIPAYLRRGIKFSIIKIETASIFAGEI
jgi:hypothetical protein